MTMEPLAGTASVISSAMIGSSSGGWMTTMTGRSYLRANSKVALVVSRDGHDRARASSPSGRIVGNPDRDFLVVDRVDGVAAGEDTGLFAGRRTPR